MDVISICLYTDQETLKTESHILMDKIQATIVEGCDKTNTNKKYKLNNHDKS